MRESRRVLFLAASLALAGGCGDGASVGMDAGGANDAAQTDARGDDAAGLDAGAGDDAGGVDAAALDAATDPDAATVDAARDDTGGPVGFTLTSTAYSEGGVIPDVHTCSGANTSPPLSWVGAPAGTMSYAVFFMDATTSFRHSAIYDIPVANTGLPAAVEATAMPADVPGARQPRGYPGTYGYAGPCPPSTHTYRFTLYAIDVPTLPGLTATSTLAAVQAAFMTHSLGEATLTGTFTP